MVNENLCTAKYVGCLASPCKESVCPPMCQSCINQEVTYARQRVSVLRCELEVHRLELARLGYDASHKVASK
jgi:hypothetical protein